MTKEFCDKCQAEITGENRSTTIEKSADCIDIAVKWNDPNDKIQDLCKDCLLNLLGKLDDRPKAYLVMQDGKLTSQVATETPVIAPQ